MIRDTLRLVDKDETRLEPNSTRTPRTRNNPTTSTTPCRPKQSHLEPKGPWSNHSLHVLVLGVNMKKEKKSCRHFVIRVLCVELCVVFGLWNEKQMGRNNMELSWLGGWNAEIKGESKESNSSFHTYNASRLVCEHYNTYNLC